LKSELDDSKVAVPLKARAYDEEVSRLRRIMALHSPDGVFETGLPMNPSEKKAPKLVEPIFRRANKSQSAVVESRT
jgi:hypothetical protein